MMIFSCIGRDRSGYSLVEILTVVMIVSIVASITLPVAENFFSSQQLAAEGSNLTSDIRMARSNAMANQVFTRLIFKSDLSSWIVQELIDASGNPIVGEPTTADTVGATTYDENPSNWRSILDGNAHAVDPSVEVSVTPNTAPAIFFGPQGILSSAPSANAPPIGLTTIQMMLGPADMTVTISPAGVLESEAWYSEDN